MTKLAESTTSYPLGPALGFLQRLWQLNHALERVSSQMEKRLGVTARQRLILRCLGKYPGMTAGHLASLLHVDPGTISAALRRLESRGLLRRRRDPRDRRRASLGLTEKGRELNHRAQGTVEGAVERLLASTTADQIATMTSVLDDLTRLLGEELTRG